MTQQEFYACLIKKHHLLDQLTDNARRQIRFIKQLQFKGLQRILQEREILLAELADSVNELAGGSCEPTAEATLAELQASEEKRRILLQLSRQALQLAVNEQEQTGKMLRQLRARRNVEFAYGNVASAYASLNIKG